MRSWMLTCSLVVTSVLVAGACDDGPNDGGGYGAIYCFALQP